jgi:hypothetical protein
MVLPDGLVPKVILIERFEILTPVVDNEVLTDEVFNTSPGMEKLK